MTTWSKLDTLWEGVLIDDILAAASLTAPTAFTLAHTFSANVPTGDLIGGNAMIALRYNGEPLEPTTAGRPACSCRTSTFGNRPSG